MKIIKIVLIVFNLYALSPIYYAAKWVKLARIMHKDTPEFQHELLCTCKLKSLLSCFGRV